MVTEMTFLLASPSVVETREFVDLSIHSCLFAVKTSSLHPLRSRRPPSWSATVLLSVMPRSRLSCIHQITEKWPYTYSSHIFHADFNLSTNLSSYSPASDYHIVAQCGWWLVYCGYCPWWWTSNELYICSSAPWPLRDARMSRVGTDKLRLSDIVIYWVDVMLYYASCRLLTSGFTALGIAWKLYE